MTEILAPTKETVVGIEGVIGVITPVEQKEAEPEEPPIRPVNREPYFGKSTGFGFASLRYSKWTKAFPRQQPDSESTPTKK